MTYSGPALVGVCRSRLGPGPLPLPAQMGLLSPKILLVVLNEPAELPQEAGELPFLTNGRTMHVEGGRRG